MTDPQRVLIKCPEWQQCLICGDACQPSPTEWGWFTIKVKGKIKRIHFNCADWLAILADQIRTSPVVMNL